MKKSGINLLLIIAAFAGPAVSQTYNAMSGGYNTGYGTVYGTFGLAQATQSIYNQMQIQMNMNLLRASGKKTYGPTVMQPGETVAKPRPVPPAPVPKYYGRFRGDPTVDTGKFMSDTLGETAEEKALLKQIYTTVKAGYDKEAAAKGWTNNMAGALTFFIVSNATVYHNSEVPNDETVAALYLAVSQTMDEIPEFGKMTNKNKQAFNNTLIGFAAIPLATYTEGKQNGDEATLKVARDIAGQLIEMVLMTKPENVRFEGGSMKFG